ncbi:DUF6440 family protein (plasmid) [Clostridium beijerinckii]|uniref:DUF6440 family protein n=1 Tax=Clostridium beijerinckii TaxID=1520 RepID=UPI002226BDC3|nr:DUF6440 family protein [Clostridium beijerinckii]UYZ39071.1 DUF6440 family protein [Clostridium beijerinckii]
MKKKIILILLSMVLVLNFTGCGSSTDLENDNNTKKVEGKTDETRFIETKDVYKIGFFTYYVCYDSKTNIVYLTSKNQSGLTVMYDSNGKPITIDEYNKTKEK